jgi:hypothetical protein
VLEGLIDDARRENAFGLMTSLHMLIEFGDACDFTGSDLIGWCREIGLRDIEIVPLAARPAPASPTNQSMLTRLAKYSSGRVAGAGTRPHPAEPTIRLPG